ncbi:hypothetical protein [Homoserinibacter sp. YIM 151385]|uniref:hypothetical protein n=1 Tax=Homoserinibacter sp. YIM 151385 TaxID=2985506 RepID=UPI0022F0E2C1|nr:hypothetical protein [Homoserinibacter sp. YIM 151385]WBU38697.1 hypothetical protein OF852_03680 [Homoserinibacter sp. YIM 151385]
MGANIERLEQIIATVESGANGRASVVGGSSTLAETLRDMADLLVKIRRDSGIEGETDKAYAQSVGKAITALDTQASHLDTIGKRSSEMESHLAKAAARSAELPGFDLSPEQQSIIEGAAETGGTIVGGPLAGWAAGKAADFFLGLNEDEREKKAGEILADLDSQSLDERDGIPRVARFDEQLQETAPPESPTESTPGTVGGSTLISSSAGSSAGDSGSKSGVGKQQNSGEFVGRPPQIVIDDGGTEQPVRPTRPEEPITGGPGPRPINIDGDVGGNTGGNGGPGGIGGGIGGGGGAGGIGGSAGMAGAGVGAGALGAFAASRLGGGAAGGLGAGGLGAGRLGGVSAGGGAGGVPGAAGVAGQGGAAGGAGGARGGMMGGGAAGAGGGSQGKKKRRNGQDLLAMQLDDEAAAPELGAAGRAGGRGGSADVDDSPDW